MNTFSHDQYLQGNDLGFSFHDEKDFIDPTTHDKVIENNNVIRRDLQERLDVLYSTIIPFLKNLQANPDKPYINWPDRAKKVQDFAKRLENIYRGNG